MFLAEISLVAWTHPAEDKCGLRFLSNADRDRLSRDEGTPGHVCLSATRVP